MHRVVTFEIYYIKRISKGMRTLQITYVLKEVLFVFVLLSGVWRNENTK